MGGLRCVQNSRFEPSVSDSALDHRKQIRRWITTTPPVTSVCSQPDPENFLDLARQPLDFRHPTIPPTVGLPAPAAAAPPGAPGAVEASIAGLIAGTGPDQVWVMDGAATGLAEVLRVTSLKSMDRGQSEISFWVAPTVWNAGFASESVAALVQANPQKSRTIFAEIFQDNPGSARVLTNCGFACAGDAESFSVVRNARVPTWTYLKELDSGRLAR
ncbi:MAG: GNAT family N-acetyltransferase [Rhodobacter sp.]|nr:GNAT family N-acetyltransferase [Rhodobacter sp.]